MGQARYFARGTQPAADRAYAALDAAFGDEGLPVSIFEWDEAAGIFEVAVYFDVSQEPAQDAAIAAFAPLTPEREDLPDVDWMQSVLAELKPVRAGRFLVHGAHDRGRVKANDIGIEIEAGQAFGTGHHGTTAGCLQLIGDVLRRKAPQTALDLGTGSAVLAIAIARLGRIPVLATDIDPVAVRVAVDNVRANGVAGLVTGAVATGFAGPAFADGARFDLIVANILAGPLMRLAPQMERRLQRGGDIILSGILARQRRAVLAAYRDQGLYHRRTLQMGDWVTLHLTR
ncbi:50S ribosomal protein L11 methyltransferase [Aureimonas frigidaquae]|uniref:50S ribosomal protein L11 methyltransferase n=1 Tax=Aureimonas frigidaquae TaxID=424757 RepID=UPI0007811B42|nr:50S ribosomal protein L11 methyltransferase [Aureimonas frigidaquae]